MKKTKKILYLCLSVFLLCPLTIKTTVAGIEDDIDEIIYNGTFVEKFESTPYLNNLKEYYSSLVNAQQQQEEEEEEEEEEYEEKVSILACAFQVLGDYYMSQVLTNLLILSEATTIEIEETIGKAAEAYFYSLKSSPFNDALIYHLNNEVHITSFSLPKRNIERIKEILKNKIQGRT
jgi:hypothetical protein